jgi:iron transport multicopper oxidase
VYSGRNDPYKSLYDVDNSSTVITLADWYHEPSLLDLPYAYPDATLVNGLGRAWENTTATDLAVVSVERGQRYRLRIVSLSCQPAFTFSIDNHTFTVIEADGVLHQKYSIDSVTIYPGQRYSAILNAHLPVDNYWIRVLPVADGLTFPSGVYAGDGNAAILRYLGAPIWHPITRSTVRHALDESQLIPYANAAPPGSPSVIAPDVYSLDLDFTLDRTNFVYYMNGFVDALPSVPVLAQILSGAGSVHDLLPTSQIISLPRNTVVQLSFPGGDTAPDTRHSIHMHGHSFSVVRSAGQQTYNFVNPPQRDVVNTGQSGDVTTIRFVTDNSGPWVLYDHVAWHSIAGFMVVL